MNCNLRSAINTFFVIALLGVTTSACDLTVEGSSKSLEAINAVTIIEYVQSTMNGDVCRVNVGLHDKEADYWALLFKDGQEISGRQGVYDEMQDVFLDTMGSGGCPKPEVLVLRRGDEVIGLDSSMLRHGDESTMQDVEFLMYQRGNGKE